MTGDGDIQNVEDPGRRLAMLQDQFRERRAVRRAELVAYLADRELPGSPPEIDPDVAACKAGMEAVLGKRGAP